MRSEPCRHSSHIVDTNGGKKQPTAIKDDYKKIHTNLTTTHPPSHIFNNQETIIANYK